MFRKLGEAIQLLAGNFLLIAMLILTVWLPGNLLINYLAFFVVEPDDEIRLLRATMWIEGIFGPIYLGAMIHALWQIKQGKPVSYGQAMRIGLTNWGRLFGARFVAGLLICLGLIALIVPGVVLAVRYALLDCAVIVEGAGVSEARRRSTQLTRGIRLPILGMAVLFYLGFVFVAAIIYLPLFAAQELAEFDVPVAMVSQVAADCLLDIVFAVLQIALFLYYWDQRQAELAAEPSASAQAVVPAKGFTDAAPQREELSDDGNPYRPPPM